MRPPKTRPCGSTITGAMGAAAAGAGVGAGGAETAAAGVGAFAALCFSARCAAAKRPSTL